MKVAFGKFLQEHYVSLISSEWNLLLEAYRDYEI